MCHLYCQSVVNTVDLELLSAPRQEPGSVEDPTRDRYPVSLQACHPVFLEARYLAWDSKVYSHQRLWQLHEGAEEN